MSEPRTERVRILVAIGRDGQTVFQYDRGDDKDTIQSMRDGGCLGYLLPPIGFHWIEADIPLPTIGAAPIPATTTSVKDPSP